MDDDDLEPRKKQIERPDFYRYSVSDINEYIDELKEEIERAEAEIAKKGDARSAAESVFK